MLALMRLIALGTIFCLHMNVSAETLTCKTSFMTTPGQTLDTKFHDLTNHRTSDFFGFTVSDEGDDVHFIHQNSCVTGKQINDRRLKGTLCLFVTTGAKTVSELGRVPSKDPYFDEASNIATFSVYHTAGAHRPLKAKTFLNASSEMTTPISSFRGTFQGNGGGLHSLTITCVRDN